MSRNRFVQPQTVRLSLADVYRRDLAALSSRKDEKGQPKPPTAEELADAQAALKDAEEDGAFIDVKRELSSGETRRVFARLVREMHAGEKIELEPERVGLTKIAEYLVGWSFTDGNGQPVPVSDDAINQLDQDTFREISRAIEWHEEQISSERRKKVRGETPASAAISPSVV